VLYFPDEWEVAYLGGFCRGEHTAHIVEVHSDRLINVVVFNRNGVAFPRISVPLQQDGDEPICGRHCEWMPYQAKKAAAGDNNSESAEPRPK
jgi:hypothetical protein